MVSNISMNRKVNTTTSMSKLRTLCHSNLQKMGSTECGRATKPPIFVMASPVLGSLITRPKAVVMRIPQRIPPRILAITRPEVMRRPTMASIAVPLVISPRPTSVESLCTMIPAFCIPMKAMNRPIPAPMDFLRVPGMALSSQLRILVTVRMMNRIPSSRTAVRANCQV